MGIGIGIRWVGGATHGEGAGSRADFRRGCANTRGHSPRVNNIKMILCQVNEGKRDFDTLANETKDEFYDHVSCRISLSIQSGCISQM